MRCNTSDSTDMKKLLTVKPFFLQNSVIAALFTLIRST